MAYTINLQRKAVKAKVEQVERVAAELKGYPTVALLELMQLSDSLFQSLRKKITQEGGRVRVLKKPVLERVLSGAGVMAPYATRVDRTFALIMTKMSPYMLNQFFKQNRKKRAAKAGEKAPFEIVIPAGDTDIPPGPALSELKTAGISVQIKGGKIAISKDSVVAKPGEVINDLKAKALQKLGILPFEVRARLCVAADGQYAYTSELLDLGDTIQQDMALAIGQGNDFSLNTGYPTAVTAPLLLTNAIRQAVDLSVNASLYNDTTMATLLSAALRQAISLDGSTGGGEKK